MLTATGRPATRAGSNRACDIAPSMLCDGPRFAAAGRRRLTVLGMQLEVDEPSLARHDRRQRKRRIVVSSLVESPVERVRSGFEATASSTRGISMRASTTTGFWLNPGLVSAAKRIMLSMIVDARRRSAPAAPSPA